MGKKSFLSAVQIIFLLTSTAIVNAYAYELPARLQILVGQTFEQQGPNCFAAALNGAGVYTSFRGISEREFSAVLEAACQKVDEPVFGDIGVYSSEGFGYVHAFLYVDEQTAFEKPGVDYVGQTPIRLQHQNSVDYVHMASPECRRFGDETCHNQKSFFRCGSVQFSSKFSAVLGKLDLILNKALHSQKVSVATEDVIRGLYAELSGVVGSDLEEVVLESVEKQMLFFKFESQSLMLF